MVKDNDGRTSGEFPNVPSEPSPKGSSGSSKPKQTGPIAPNGIFLE